MNPSPRPVDAAPGGMRGAGRMLDPSEADHDRRRRLIMNVALLVVIALSLPQFIWIRPRGWDWLGVALLVIAAMPAGLGVKLFELRFKMSRKDRHAVLADVPRRRQVELAVYAVAMLIALALNVARASWALFGVWIYDFVTYYHDRPERMRHLYAVTKTLDELRGLRAPWAWALPALAWELARRFI
jgi:hypothetical protein